MREIRVVREPHCVFLRGHDKLALTWKFVKLFLKHSHIALGKSMVVGESEQLHLGLIVAQVLHERTWIATPVRVSIESLSVSQSRYGMYVTLSGKTLTR